MKAKIISACIVVLIIAHVASGKIKPAKNSASAKQPSPTVKLKEIKGTARTIVANGKGIAIKCEAPFNRTCMYVVGKIDDEGLTIDPTCSGYISTTDLNPPFSYPFDENKLYMGLLEESSTHYYEMSSISLDCTIEPGIINVSFFPPFDVEIIAE